MSLFDMRASEVAVAVASIVTVSNLVGFAKPAQSGAGMAQMKALGRGILLYAAT